MSMELSKIYENYSADYNANAGMQGLENNTKTENIGKSSHKSVKEYEDYLRKKYECLTSTKTSAVVIAPSLMRQAARDEKTAGWLEYNLSIMPEVDEKIRAAVEMRGAKMLYCHTTIDGYDSMTTEVMTVDEADPGTDKIRERTEKAVKRRREEKKAEEKKQEERKEKERLEKLKEKNQDESSFIITGTDIKDIASRLISSIRGEASVSSFDIRI